MTHFGELSLRTKLAVMVAAASSTGLLLACGLIIANEMNAFIARARDTVTVMANTIGFNVAVALVFDDEQDASDSLSALRADPNVMAAAVYTTEGELFAQYRRAGEPASIIEANPGSFGTRFIGRHLAAVQPVVHEREIVGTLYLRSDLKQLYARMSRYISMTVIVMLAGFLVALFTAALMARVVAAPVADLARTAEDVTRRKDYSVRARKHADDEIGVLIDAFNDMLTRIQERDDELLRSQSDLERRVRERTAELEASNRSLSAEIETRQLIQQELIHARDRAEAANRAKSTFLANMSHDLRTPLTAVIGFSEMLEENTVRNGHQIYVSDLKQIQKAAGHLLSLLSDLLDLSKIEAGKMVMQPEAVDLREFMRELAAPARQLCDAKHNQLTLDCPPDVGTLVTDRTRLRQILYNLLSNAAKFTERGRVSVSIARASGNGDGVVTFTVRDTGIGMDAEDLTHVFEPFVQGHRGSAWQYGGSGLGLAICKRCCELMQGDIEVASAPGQGTTFTVRIPGHTPAAAA